MNDLHICQMTLDFGDSFHHLFPPAIAATCRVIFCCVVIVNMFAQASNIASVKSFIL